MLGEHPNILLQVKARKLQYFYVMTDRPIKAPWWQF